METTKTSRSYEAKKTARTGKKRPSQRLPILAAGLLALAAAGACSFDTETQDAAGLGDGGSGVESATLTQDLEQPCLVTLTPPEAVEGAGTACVPRSGLFSIEELQEFGLEGDRIESLNMEDGMRVVLSYRDGRDDAFDAVVPLFPETQASAEIFSVRVERCAAALTFQGDSVATKLCLDEGKWLIDDAAWGDDVRPLEKFEVAFPYSAEVLTRSGETIIVDPRLDADDTHRITSLNEFAVFEISRGPARSEPLDPVENYPASDQQVSELLSTGLGVNLVAQRARGNKVKPVVVFGDSLSDTGRLHGSYIPGKGHIPHEENGYWRGRFTNGYNWVDYLKQDSNLTVINRAVGGSESYRSWPYRASASAQASKFLSEQGKKSNQFQYVIFTGANDMLNYWSGFNPRGAKGKDWGHKVGKNIQSIIKKIEKQAAPGRPKITLVTLPELTHTPAAQGENWSPGKRAWYQDARRALNSDLNQFKSRTRSSVDVFDLHGFIERWRGRTVKAQAMNDVSNACRGNRSGAEDNRKGEGYRSRNCYGKMYFDKVHPTSIAHCGIAAAIRPQLIPGAKLPDALERIRRCSQRPRDGQQDSCRDNQLRLSNGECASRNCGVSWKRRLVNGSCVAKDCPHSGAVRSAAGRCLCPSGSFPSAGRCVAHSHKRSPELGRRFLRHFQTGKYLSANNLRFETFEGRPSSWTFEALISGKYRLRTQGLCLLWAGTLGACSNATAVWRVQRDEHATYTIRADTVPEKCLDGNGSSSYVIRCNGGGFQRWSLDRGTPNP